MNELIKKLNDFTCVVSKNDLLSTSRERGIKPIVNWFKEDENFFSGSIVADRVIGKAAAMLLAYGKAKMVYAKIISEPAILVLEKSGILFEFEKKVPFIENRDKTGRCPMETRVISMKSNLEAYHEFLSLQI